VYKKQEEDADAKSRKDNAPSVADKRNLSAQECHNILSDERLTMTAASVARWRQVSLLVRSFILFAHHDPLGGLVHILEPVLWLQPVQRRELIVSRSSEERAPRCSPCTRSRKRTPTPRAGRITPRASPTRGNDGRPDGRGRNGQHGEHHPIRPRKLFRKTEHFHIARRHFLENVVAFLGRKVALVGDPRVKPAHKMT
jgi:hypothetical protein